MHTHTTHTHTHTHTHTNICIQVYEELEKFGKIDELNVCANLGDHMIGNVYVKYEEEEFAEKVCVISLSLSLSPSPFPFPSPSLSPSLPPLSLPLSLAPQSPRRSLMLSSL